ncbi:MAG: hypothetical protein IT456_04810 [Planctomycetes bacterium]|nr:hypothetical protein [Planctomycetota bacterium]MCC7062103.1 hypothetical protein [Planctomycetota bacterium]
MTGTSAFCHISEFNQAGYNQLHALAAVSKPLILWAPSGHFLLNAYANDKTPVDFEAFLRLLDKGFIRVVARADWFNEKLRRGKHLEAVKNRGYLGYSWAAGFDDEIVARLDRTRPGNNQHPVFSVAEEDGLPKAEARLAKDPGVVETLLSMESQWALPRGMLEQSRGSAGKDDNEFSRQVLRHARNHTRAWLDVGADHDLLPSPLAGVLWQLVDKEINHDVATRVESMLKIRRRSVDLDQLTEAVSFLARLGSRKPSGDFLGSADHDSAVKWFALAAEQADSLTLRDICHRLRSEIQRGMSPNDSRTRRSRHLSRLGKYASTPIVKVLEWVTDIKLGLVKLLWSRRKDVQKDFAYTSPYEGPQWPFRYLWSRKADDRDKRNMIRRIDGILRGDR